MQPFNLIKSRYSVWWAPTKQRIRRRNTCSCLLNNSYTSNRIHHMVRTHVRWRNSPAEWFRGIPKCREGGVQYEVRYL